MSVHRVIGCAAAALLSATGPAAAQTAQLPGPNGTTWNSLRDTGAVARAEQAVREEPGNVQRLTNLGIAQGSIWQFREAVATFTRALELDPGNAVLYRWRGHRLLSVRSFDLALADLERGARLDSTIYGIWYHLGVVRYARGEFPLAAEAFARARTMPPNAGELAGSIDWQWMALMRAGNAAAASALLAGMHASVIPGAANAYARRLQLYRGELTPDQVFTASDTANVAVATLAYGVGNWYLVQGDTTRARSWFTRATASDGWPAFGYIAAEADLRRLR